MKKDDEYYTPENIMRVVDDWVFWNCDYMPGRDRIERPFGQDKLYTLEYALSDDGYENAVVIDNPPFSKVSEICKFYNMCHVRYFLFTYSNMFVRVEGTSNIIANANIEYIRPDRRKKKIKTNFVTNMLKDNPTGVSKLVISYDLHLRLKNVGNKKYSQGIWNEPANIRPWKANSLAIHGVNASFDASFDSEVNGISVIGGNCRVEVPSPEGYEFYLLKFAEFGAIL